MIQEIVALYRHTQRAITQLPFLQWLGLSDEKESNSCPSLANLTRKTLVSLHNSRQPSTEHTGIPTCNSEIYSALLFYCAHNLLSPTDCQTTRFLFIRTQALKFESNSFHHRSHKNSQATPALTRLFKPKSLVR